MGTWFYGLIEFKEGKEKHIELCEIYSNGAIAQVSFEELDKEAKQLVKEDLIGQLKHNEQYFWINKKLIKKNG